MVSAFLLPLCPRCGSGMSLALFESETVDGTPEVRTFRCDACGVQDVQQASRPAAGARNRSRVC
jgi:hypothetical protein